MKDQAANDPNTPSAAALQQEVDRLNLTVAGLNECLDVANQMLVATLLRHGGSIRLTPDDYRNSRGIMVERLDVGDDVLLQVPVAPEAQAAAPAPSPLILPPGLVS